MIIVKVQDSHKPTGKRWRTIGAHVYEGGPITVDINSYHPKDGVRRYVRFEGGEGELPKREQLKRLRAHSKRMYAILAKHKVKRAATRHRKSS